MHKPPVHSRLQASQLCRSAPVLATFSTQCQFLPHADGHNVFTVFNIEGLILVFASLAALELRRNDPQGCHSPCPLHLLDPFVP